MNKKIENAILNMIGIIVGGLIVMAILYGFNRLTVKQLDRLFDEEPNCWEKTITGTHTRTGNQAYYSVNFDCEYFSEDNN